MSDLPDSLLESGRLGRAQVDSRCISTAKAHFLLPCRSLSVLLGKDIQGGSVGRARDQSQESWISILTFAG